MTSCAMTVRITRRLNSYTDKARTTNLSHQRDAESTTRVALFLSRPSQGNSGRQPNTGPASCRLPEGAAARQMDFEADIVAHELVLVMDKFTAADVLREVSVYDTINKAARYTSKVRPVPRPHRQAWAVKVNTFRGSSIHVWRTMLSRAASYCAGRRRR